MLFPCLWPKLLAGGVLFWLSFSQFNIFWLQSSFLKHLKNSFLIENHCIGWHCLKICFPRIRVSGRQLSRQSGSRGGVGISRSQINRVLLSLRFFIIFSPFFLRKQAVFLFLETWHLSTIYMCAILEAKDGCRQRFICDMSAQMLWNGIKPGQQKTLISYFIARVNSV